MAAEEQIVSPDQRKPVNRKAMYAALLIGAAIILTFLFGNHQGRVEDAFLIIFAGGLVLYVAVDAWLRKSGLR